MGNIKKNKAFTLMEVVVAVAIISLGLVGVLAVVRRSLYIQPLTKNQIIANNLAQEGLEIVRNMRDTNWLRGNNWRLGLGEELVLGGKKIGCVDYDSANFISPCLKQALAINENGFYVHGAAANTPYERFITIEYKVDREDVDYLLVQSTVKWQERGHQRIETVEEFLYNWEQ